MFTSGLICLKVADQTVGDEPLSPFNCNLLKDRRIKNCQYYFEMLEHKRSGASAVNSWQIVSFVSTTNVCSHTAHLTCDKLQELGWEVLSHLAYSPDLAPSDFYLSGSLKDALRKNIC